MITTYFRSSSLNDLLSCELKYFLNYVLGFKLPSNKAADIGSVSHKALEFIARKKLCFQNDADTFYDDDFDCDFIANEVNLDWAVNHAWDLYTRIKPIRDDFKPADLKTVTKNVMMVRDWQDGLFWPMNLNILGVEYFFDIPINEEWAFYEYNTRQGKVSGQLHLVGTCDLLVKSPNDDCLILQDYKTGARKCWRTGAVKDYDKMRKDPQLRLYHYALSKCFPNYDHALFTLFFTKEDDRSGVQNHGPYSVPFYKEDIPDTERAIRKYFEQCKQLRVPSNISKDRSKNWACNFCQYKKNDFPDTSVSYCNYMQRELVNIGIDKVLKIRYNKEVANTYSGGGKERVRGE